MKNPATFTTPSDREIVVTRRFNAPRKLVWDTMTQVELKKRWMTGPPGWVMTVGESDTRTGGTFRAVWTGPNGETLTMSGEYRDVTPPERCVRTEKFEMVGGPPMGEQLATLVLTDEGDKTLMTLTLEYATKEARDGAAASGMEHGMEASYARLDEILAAA
ncbi:SRPBCC family protein [Urbifossiella limnaea]|uniref:Activator of Hsp90 ATPase homologue 1/2-like C-terminal domain-containing protein n=1 Tax=Urbifossiella limnaea TaxID=2528023 RepID=A0A517XS43_9BACT|nr:SRPBCC family protein [Urbifossiella limnaea]QDU20330.1 hypothetical protein ETAA1_22820 [Urbifossiella limnaea]